VPAIGLPVTEGSPAETEASEPPLRVADELLIEFASPESLFPPEAVTREWLVEPREEAAPEATEPTPEQPVPADRSVVAEPTPSEETTPEPLPVEETERNRSADNQATSPEQPTPASVPLQDATSPGTPAANSAEQQNPAVEDPAAPPAALDDTPPAAPVEPPAPQDLPAGDLPASEETARGLEDLPPAPAVIEEVPVVNLCVPPEEVLIEARPEIAPTGEAPATPVLPTPATSDSTPATSDASPEPVSPEPVSSEPAAGTAPPEAVHAEVTQPATTALEPTNTERADSVLESEDNVPAPLPAAESAPSVTAESEPATVESAETIVTQPVEETTDSQPLESASVTPIEPQREVFPPMPIEELETREIPLDHQHCPFGHGMLPARQSPPFRAIDLSLIRTAESAE
jgi:hypothetical protein